MANLAIKRLSRPGTAFCSWIKTFDFKKAAANQENIDLKILNKYLDIGMNNTISSKVLNQFLLFYRHNTFC